jgi:hypothetical protein
MTEEESNAFETFKRFKSFKSFKSSGRQDKEEIHS